MFVFNFVYYFDDSGSNYKNKAKKLSQLCQHVSKTMMILVEYSRRRNPVILLNIINRNVQMLVKLFVCVWFNHDLYEAIGLDIV